MRVGGAAEVLLEPTTPDELVQAYGEAHERGLEVRMLGGGANLLIADGVLPGVVITTERMGRVFRPFREEGAEWTFGGDPARESTSESEPPVLVAWAGMGLPGLCRTARELGWSGLEGLVGVPGHVGGGVAMNAGGRWGDLWDVVEKVHVLRADGTTEERERDQCQPGYRNGGLGDAIVLGAVFRLERAPRPEIKDRMAGFLAEKSAAQPVTERSSGCIFKNPDREASGGRSAGQLVDDCGAKGLTEGDAIVSPKHGNFIVNRGKARATDVLALIERVRDLVEDRTGVRLATEVKTWPVPLAD